MVSYYSLEDVLAGRLRTPSEHVELLSLEISREYLLARNFELPSNLDAEPSSLLQYRSVL